MLSSSHEINYQIPKKEIHQSIEVKYEEIDQVSYAEVDPTPSINEITKPYFKKLYSLPIPIEVWLHLRTLAL